jgi:hypothetical protein
MSEPMYSPPPPPAPPPMPPMGGAPAAQQVQGPAIALLVVGILGVLAQIAGLLMNALGVGMGALGNMGGGASDRYMQMFSGGIGIVVGILALAMYGFVVWASLQMKQLRGWNISLAGSIVSMLPCSCCCIIGLPIGIWSLIVLMKPEVKSAFVG